MKVKILDSDLIRRFGGAYVEMNIDLAISMERKGKVKIVEECKKETIFEEDNTVLVFSGKQEIKNVIPAGKKFPDVNDPIFPQIKV